MAFDKIFRVSVGYNTTELGIHLTYTKDLLENLYYPRGTTVKGKCMEGYKSSGKLRKRCKKNGQWNGASDLNCTLITCSVIDDLEPGVIVQPESCGLEASLVKQKCQFSCADSKHFKLIGSKVARCKKTGTWKQKGGAPKCVEKKKRRKKKKKKEKKNKKNLSDPLSTISVPAVSSTLPPWPSTIPWEQTYQPPAWTTTSTTTSSTPMPPTTTSGGHGGQNFPAPFIYCPPDVVKDLPSISPNVSAPTVYIRIPQPKTNVNWYDYVKSYPPWAKSLEAELGLGKTLVTFTATSPVGGNEVASCSFAIHVRDIIPPRVYNCPNDFDIYLDEGQIDKQIFWEEPIFADNVKIAHVMASKLPGYKMKAGRHDVLYQAADSDGNKARCVFTVTVWDSSRVHRQTRRYYFLDH